ncbi:FAD/NAD(P)-binding domain-containing protein [Xylariaceae sp. FL0255]|nr:FAD/NAD(P)-binding domain-containing protein [Xylariaceae sp. FL0255]
MSSPPSQTSPAPIAIIGAGPCGLTLARLLEKSNPRIPYRVFERDVSATANGTLSQGGTLDLHPHSGQAALKAAGLEDEFERLCRRNAASVFFQNSHGGDLVRFGAGEGSAPPEKGSAHDRPEIDRVQLRDMLLKSIPEENVVWGKKLQSIERSSDMKDKVTAGAKGWTLKFEDGSEETGFRLIVGADGAWSKVRPLISNAKPYYSGYTYIEGRINPTNPQYAAVRAMVGAGNSAAMGNGRLLVIQQMSDESYRLYAGVQEPEGFTKAGGLVDLSHGDTEKSRADLLKAYDGWAEHLLDYLKAAEGPWRYWPLNTLSADVFAPEALGTEAWKRAPGVVLIGDAAHLAVPNGGGVNEAMLDALKLSECISAELKGGYDSGTDAESLERAIVAYETEMRPRAHEHVLDGIMMSEVMFSEDGAKKLNAMFNSTGAQESTA